MALTPVQQAAREIIARGGKPRLGRYFLGGSAKRMGAKRLGTAARKLALELGEAAARLLPEAARTDAEPATAAPPPPMALKDIRQILKPMTDTFTRRARAQTAPVLDEAEREERAASGREVATLGLDVVGKEPWLKSEISTRSTEFTALIKDVGTDTERRIAGLAAQALEKGRSRDWLRQQVEDVAGVSERRAALIARDQIGKLQGALHEARQQDIGIDRYTWRNSRDARVAGNPSGLYPDVPSDSETHGNHWEREGRIFLWKKSGGALVEVLPDGTTQVTEYVDGHPGEPIADRCFAEGIIPGLEDLQNLKEEAPEAKGPNKTPGRRR